MSWGKNLHEDIRNTFHSVTFTTAKDNPLKYLRNRQTSSAILRCKNSLVSYITLYSECLSDNNISDEKMPAANFIVRLGSEQLPGIQYRPIDPVRPTSRFDVPFPLRMTWTGDWVVRVTYGLPLQDNCPVFQPTSGLKFFCFLFACFHGHCRKFIRGKGKGEQVQERQDSS